MYFGIQVSWVKEVNEFLKSGRDSSRFYVRGIYVFLTGLTQIWEFILLTIKD